MPGILLAPYNDSMRLGQGYNSFLHIPCVHDAVIVTEENIVKKPAATSGSVSQIVNYSSRFVEKISEVAKSMNISAGSSIKNGGIIASGSALTIDEAKFAASDFNAIVSVKVINQTTELVEHARFDEIPDLELTSEKFFKIYGDCYISGFIEGGELTGLVSAQVLDAAHKVDVERAVKGYINSAGAAARPTDFTLNEGAKPGSSSSALSKTETTITVNWSGGGQIKQEGTEWSLDLLYKTAAGFPARVAECPQRTWAILTPYYHNKDFVRWAEKKNIKVPQFDGALSYTADLLDMYMEYKNCLARIQAVLSNPVDYMPSRAADPFPITVNGLLQVRTRAKAEMKAIVATLDKICKNPETVDEIEDKALITAPELWSYRLPVLRRTAEASTSWTPAQAEAELLGFSFTADDQPTPPQEQQQSTEIKAPVSQPTGDQEEKGKSKVVSPVPVSQPVGSKEETKEPKVVPQAPIKETPVPKAMPPAPEAKLPASEVRPPPPVQLPREEVFMNGYEVGSRGGGAFNDGDSLKRSMAPVGWPQSIQFNFVRWGSGVTILGWVTTRLISMTLTHGNDQQTSVDGVTAKMGSGEYVTKIRLAKGVENHGVEGIIFVELTTSRGKLYTAGDAGQQQITTSEAPSGFPGLKGFYGSSAIVIDRLGPLWGRV